MLAATGLPTTEEREQALVHVPWRAESRQLSGKAYGLLRHQSAELIDVAVGTTHARAALVALQEGAESVFQSALDIVEGTLADAVLKRSDIVDPLGVGECLHDGEDPERLRKRGLRVRLEDAAVRVASAGNHLVNAHLRLAWEANAATAGEARKCGFDPQSERPENWASVSRMAQGVEKARKSPMSVLPHFALQPAFDSYINDFDVEQVRELRNRIVHRDRPSYADAPAIGRTSLWSGESFSISFPAPAHPIGADPSIAETRSQIASAASATLAYGDPIWSLAIRWLRTVDVFVDWTPGQVTIRTDIQPGQAGPRRAREGRDPGPFLLS